jgi:superfamily II DNA or RNA helicase
MQLRYYQEEAVKAILETWGLGTRSTLLVLPTGTGKTIAFAKLTEYVVGNHAAKVLILAHREELLNQAADKIEIVTGLKSALEKADSCSVDSWLNVVTGSVQSLQNEKRLAKFEPDHFTHIIIDEAHHAVSPSYRRIIDYFSEAKVLGVTATADRGDKRNLAEVFDSLAYEYTLPEAINDGFLVPIKARTIPLDIDLTKVKSQAGDFQAAALGNALDPYLDQIADAIIKYCSDRKTVVFLPLIATSQKFKDLLIKKGLAAAEINGESKDRKEVLTDFNAGKYQVLCNSMLLTEGWDEPQVDCIVCLRPTKVRALYAQIVGRGTRLFPGKKDLLVLDFLWHTAKLDLCRPAHLICENSDIVGRVAEILAEDCTDEEKDLFGAVEEAESTAQEEREESLAKKLAEQKKKRAKLVDVLQYEHSIVDKAEDYTPDPNNLREQAPATDAQKAVIEKAGLNPDAIKCVGHASTIIETIKKRKEAGLTSAKQIRCLEAHGFQNVGQWKLQDASNMVQRLAGAGWRASRLNGINPQTYKPGL